MKAPKLGSSDRLKKGEATGKKSAAKIPAAVAAKSGKARKGGK